MNKFFAAMAMMAVAAVANAATITGAGATFPAPVYSKWAEGYAQAGHKVNYQAIGSSGGLRQIDAKTVDFGATDDPRDSDEVKSKGQLQFPTVMGAVVPVVNLDGVGPGDFTLDGATFGAIFAGKITVWNDPAIQKLNPKIKLPATKITIVHRSDGSGTTAVFSDYLARVSPEFKSVVGAGKQLKWPGLAVGGKGNAGVAAMVKQVKGSIGYVEYAYAKQNKLAHSALINRSGKRVQPSAESFKAAAANADWNTPGMAVNLNDQKGDAAWPNTAATFILVYDNKSEESKRAIAFFDWAFANGDAAADSLDYVPLPDSVKNKIRADWKKAGLQ